MTCKEPYGYCDRLEELRKGGLSEADAQKQIDGMHWTEWHPDRGMWSPGQATHARMQTQDEYEALYGRGRPRDYVCSCERGNTAQSQGSGRGFGDLRERLDVIEGKIDRLLSHLGA